MTTHDDAHVCLPDASDQDADSRPRRSRYDEGEPLPARADVERHADPIHVAPEGWVP